MSKEELKLCDCPYCGKAPNIELIFGQAVISCRNSSCSMRPNTWLTNIGSTDIAVVAKVWNKRPEAKGKFS